jgi:hypothetical protein
MQRPRPTPASIVRQIAQLRAQPAHTQLARILDDLDAWGAVETALKALPRLTSWGPKAVRGMTPAPWVGVVVWQRAAGYTGYKTLTIIGIWAQQDGEATRVIVGRKSLAFAAPFYEAEAYHKLIRNGFDLYYSDDGAPPAAPLRRYDALYAPDARLATRDVVRAALLT